MHDSLLLLLGSATKLRIKTLHESLIVDARLEAKRLGHSIDALSDLRRDALHDHLAIPELVDLREPLLDDSEFPDHRCLLRLILLQLIL